MNLKKLKYILENYKKQITSTEPRKKGPSLTEKDKEILRSLGYAQ